jgi:hypothetical protein
MPRSVVAIALHRHRLERIPHMPGLQQFDRKSCLLHRRVKPLRQRSGFEPDPHQAEAE